DRGAPDRHDRIADELLHRPAVPLDRVAGDVEVAGQELAGGLGVAVLGQGGEADEVGEEDGDQPPLGDGRRVRSRCARARGRVRRRRIIAEGEAAGTAEARIRLDAFTARWARRGERGPARLAEASTRLVL